MFDNLTWKHWLFILAVVIIALRFKPQIQKLPLIGPLAG